ncbi:MAG: thioesterase family protein [Flavobacteriaceae bacterium]|nr:thioesterase family protein [Flavobacteriaceae bacterium]
MSYKINFHTKWADFDANKHMRHTAYNDYAAECRIRFFNENGLPASKFEEHNFGPILFTESTTFYREIKLGEQLSIDLRLSGLSQNGERFKMIHRLYREDGVLAAEIAIYAAWLDLEKRKLTVPPIDILSMFNSLERTEDFEEIELKSKKV